MACLSAPISCDCSSLRTSIRSPSSSATRKTLTYHLPNSVVMRMESRACSVMSTAPTSPVLSNPCRLPPHRHHHHQNSHRLRHPRPALHRQQVRMGVRLHRLRGSHSAFAIQFHPTASGEEPVRAQQLLHHPISRIPKQVLQGIGVDLDFPEQHGHLHAGNHHLQGQHQ